MANILEELGKGMWDSIKSPWKVVEHTAKGEFGEAWHDLKAIPGNQERHNSEILNAAGIRGWVGDHPGETAAGVIGTVIAAPYVAAGAQSLFGAGGSTGVGASEFATADMSTLSGGASKPNRWGKVLSDVGSQLTSGSQQQQVSAPAFKPSFNQQQAPAFGSDVMSQLGSADYNI